jgi:phosphoenolpyruvate carboxykinase (ATP)
MQSFGIHGKFGLENHGFYNIGNEHWNYSSAKLIQEALLRDEVLLSADGAVIATTGKHTGRSPNDKFVVDYKNSISDEIWWGPVNKPIDPVVFDLLSNKLIAFYQQRDVFIQDMLAGAHPDIQLPIRIITEKAWHNLFSRNLFIHTRPSKIENYVPEYTVIQSESFQGLPEVDGIPSETFILVNFDKKIVLIGGTGYAGEIKKSVFTIMNFLLPQKNILAMHCSANVGMEGDVALFFGLSGTGKTTLSSDPQRRLIGDDEHGWCEDGVFNFEGGCYAKTIRLNQKLEPLIWAATHRFGSVLENVDFDINSRIVDFDSDIHTENTRAAYPLSFIPNHVPEGRAGHPENIFFLTADAFGVMPPIAKLTHEQALYYFLSGYTSKLAGTETGLGQEPQATFSTCFGAPFLPLHPNRYAELLGEKITRHNASVWLINTGWTGGPYGIGSRIKLPYTRAMIHAVLNHQLENVPLWRDEYFGLYIPETCPDVPQEILNPIKTWADQAAYHRTAHTLIARFEDNCSQYSGVVSQSILAHGPHNL